MSDRKQEISRRSFLKGVGAVVTTVALSEGFQIAPVAAALSSQPTERVRTQCAPVVLPEDCPKVARFEIFGRRDIILTRDNVETGRYRSDETAHGVDLRLSLAQDPSNTWMWGTFKGTPEYRQGDLARLIQMGPVVNGVEHGKQKLDLLGPNFEVRGCYPFDDEAKIEECGIEVLRPAWKFNVERILKTDGKRVFRYEYSFPVVPDCGEAFREYIDNVKREERAIGPTPTTVVPTPAPGTGTPGRQPAQLPRSGDGSTPIETNPNIPRWPGH